MRGGVRLAITTLVLLDMQFNLGCPGRLGFGRELCVGRMRPGFRTGDWTNGSGDLIVRLLVLVSCERRDAESGWEDGSLGFVPGRFRGFGPGVSGTQT